ncbi:MAG: leucine-rich repeat domain-containing protein [Bacteroidales bacterium]|nr:leucine-rich repeat domain-containing protein [Bacteroidales bacterium]
MKALLTYSLLTIALFTPKHAIAQDDDNATWYDITLTDPNTLSTLLANALPEDQTLADVQYLRLSGIPGDDDIAIIKSNLTGLVEVDLTNLNVTLLASYLFDNSSSAKPSLKKVTLPSGLVTVGSYCFRQCSALEQVVLPSTLTTINTHGFYQCSALTSFDFLSTNIKTIGTYAFAYSGLEAVELPSDTSLQINSNAFNQSSIKSLKFNGAVYSIGANAFRDCTDLSDIEWFTSLQSISDHTFYGATSLTSVTLPDCLGAVTDYMFYNCTALTSVTIPSSVKYIGAYAFHYCTSLTSVNIAEGLEGIAERGFASCSKLPEITLPSSLVHIGELVFNRCDAMTCVTSKAFLPPSLPTEGLFYNSKTDCELRVPALARTSYVAAQGWANQTTITAIDGQLPDEIASYQPMTLITNEDWDSWKPSARLMRDADLTLASATNPSSVGTLLVYGEQEWNLSKLSLYYDEYYRRYGKCQSNGIVCHTAVVNTPDMVADEVEVTVRFNTAWTNQWHFMSFPFNVDLAQHDFTDQGIYYAVYEYDGEARSLGNTGWTNVAADATLQAGNGYIFCLHRYIGDTSYSYIPLSFKAADSSVTLVNDDVTVALDEHLADFANNADWNFIGNPYLCYYDTRYITDFDAPITVRSADSTSSTSYVAYSLTDDSYVLMPGEAFFVQATTSQALTFGTAGRQVDPAPRAIAAEETATRARAASIGVDRTLINLTISDGQCTDRTRVVINPEASTAYEPRCDAPKMMSEDANALQIWTVTDQVAYAINERPAPEGAIPVGVTTTANNTCTVALTSQAAGYTVELIDSYLGITTDLAKAPYTFTTTDDDGSRLSLRISSSEVGIESVTTASAATERWYNLQGVAIPRPTAPGLYIHNGKKEIIF